PGAVVVARAGPSVPAPGPVPSVPGGPSVSRRSPPPSPSRAPIEVRAPSERPDSGSSRTASISVTRPSEATKTTTTATAGRHRTRPRRSHRRRRPPSPSAAASGRPGPSSPASRSPPARSPPSPRGAGARTASRHGPSPGSRSSRRCWSSSSRRRRWVRRRPRTYSALPTTLTTLTTAAPSPVPATPKNEATAAPDTDASTEPSSCPHDTPGASAEAALGAAEAPDVQRAADDADDADDGGAEHGAGDAEERGDGRPRHRRQHRAQHLDARDPGAVVGGAGVAATPVAGGRVDGSGIGAGAGRAHSGRTARSSAADGGEGRRGAAAGRLMPLQHLGRPRPEPNVTSGTGPGRDRRDPQVPSGEVARGAGRAGGQAPRPRLACARQLPEGPL